MKEGKKVAAVVLVAGNSTRFGQNRNKNLEVVQEKEIFLYSVEQFAKNQFVDEILIAVKKSEMPIVQNIIDEMQLKKPVQLIEGGKERKESVYHCIQKTDADIVVIHDGARPMIKQEYINQCLENMKEFKGATLGVKSKDTIKITDENNVIVSTTKRSNTWLIQTPQCFDRKILLSLHEKYQNFPVTDDCMLLEKDGYLVKVIEGDYTNIKITTYEDLEIVKKFIENGKVGFEK